MGMIGGEIGYQILRRISREGENRYMDEAVAKLFGHPNVERQYI